MRYYFMIRKNRGAGEWIKTTRNGVPVSVEYDTELLPGSPVIPVPDEVETVDTWDGQEVRRPYRTQEVRYVE